MPNDGKGYRFTEKELVELMDRVYEKGRMDEKILQMTNNINTDSNIILILYEDGRVYAFNYITGAVLFDTAKQESNLVTQVTSMLGSVFNVNKNLFISSKS